jgi:hypothetical protein
MTVGEWVLLKKVDGKPASALHMVINGRKICSKWVVIMPAARQDPNVPKCVGCLKIIRQRSLLTDPTA